MNKKIIYLWIAVVIAEILLIFSMPTYRCRFHVDDLRDPIAGKNNSCRSWRLYFENIDITNFGLDFRNQTAGLTVLYGLFALPLIVGIIVTIIWWIKARRVE
ncbi:hypothetical protein HYS31_07055 [Candidatus Woesearchaeota archaeon]|nr:hypothetical protein [Candidatus Woesearchaeota archaeon]